jgi:hypothetical protein
VKNLIHGIVHGRGGNRAVDLLIAFFDDPDEKVRNIAANAFRYAQFFNCAYAVFIAEAFVHSKALANNLNDFLYGIHDETISLRPFATALKQIAISVVSPTDDSRQRSRHATDTGLLAGLLLRLYEQSQDDKSSRTICLDAWDQLLQHIGFGVLEKIDG